LTATQRFDKSNASVAMDVLRLIAALRKVVADCDDVDRY